MLSNRNNANNQPKNYIKFVNDHSGSMQPLAEAATADYNTNIAAIKDASNREMQDTVVSVIGIGLNPGYGGCNGGNTTSVKRQVVVSNPHVLKPVTDWPTPGGTPLYDGIGEAIELGLSLPDANEAHVSFLIITTTDGQEAHSRRYNATSIAAKMRELQATGRWSFVFRVPVGQAHTITRLGVPAGNIQEWGTTEQGMKESTVATTAAMDGYFAARSAGKTSSTVFYASAAAVDTSKLAELKEGKDVSLYVVPQLNIGDKLEIRDFILTKRMKYLKGAAFYQLTKTEPKVAPSKLLVVRDRSTGKIYAGKDANGNDLTRQMLGLPTDRNVRLHPGDHGNYDIFIQSSSVNRHLVGGTGVLYWEAIGVEFTEADLAYLQPKPTAPAVTQLPAVPVTNKPTPHPQKVKTQAQVITQVASAKPVLPTVNTSVQPTPIHPKDGGRVRFHIAPAGVKFYDTREMARAQALVQGKKAYDQGPGYAKRYYVA